MFSGIHHNLLNVLSLPTFIDVLTDEFHRRRRKVPLVFKNGDPLFNRSMEPGVTDNSLFVLTFAGFTP